MWCFVLDLIWKKLRRCTITKFTSLALPIVLDIVHRAVISVVEGYWLNFIMHPDAVNPGPYHQISVGF